VTLTGCLRDPEGAARGDDVDRLVGGSSLVPDEAYLLSHVAVVPSQRGSSCVGHALAQCLRIAAHRDGTAIDPSALAIYALARQLHAPSATRLPDVGCYPHRALEALEQWGACSTDRWPDAADLGACVPVDVLEAGAVARVTGVYRIAEGGAARVRRVRAAIAQGHPVFFGMSTGDEYAFGPSRWPYEGEGTGHPGHAQVIVGYRPGAVLAANSWGRAWGLGGFAWISDNWISSDGVYGLHVVTAAPARVS
jgi:hypothetical protein